VRRTTTTRAREAAHDILSAAWCPFEFALSGCTQRRGRDNNVAAAAAIGFRAARFTDGEKIGSKALVTR
jgi:hypothetical protein